MRVNVVSLNVDGLTKSPEIEYPFFLPDNPDLYAEFTQEDARPVVLSPTTIQSIQLLQDGGGEALVTDSALNGMRLITHVSLNDNKSAQNIVLNIYIKTSGIQAPEVEQGKIVVQKGEKSGLVHLAQGFLGMYSKGAVWAKLSFPRYSILFINMHLPVKTTEGSNGKLKNATMGNAYRTKMFKQILDLLSSKVDGQTHVIVGGDLNFRMNSKGEDQLDELLKDADLPIPLKELPFPEGDKAAFTCKFKEAKNYRNDLCRLTELSDDSEATLPCADEKRNPSRCDRFLIHKHRTIRVDMYKTAVLLPHSDHNAIYTSFRIGEQEGGTRRRRGRRLTRRRKLG
jgi:hypothetical protein